MQNTFDELTLPELLEVVLSDGERADEAMWYVLHVRMETRLRGKFRDYETQLWDTYEDLVDDFFLYLREGASLCGPVARSYIRERYVALRTIKEKDAFEAWLLSTWRNYLHVRAEKEDARRTRVSSDGVERRSAEGDPLSLLIASEQLSEEQKIAVVSQLIAYCDQVFLPRGRFIFLRGIMTILNRKQALPDKDMAEALGMTDINYRVTHHRLNGNVKEFLCRVLRGESLRLNDEHKALAESINADFYSLYPLLIGCYNDALHSLKQREDVMALRLSRIKEDGSILHENESLIKMGVTAFCNRLVKELA